MKAEYRILRVLKSGVVKVVEVWATGWQILTFGDIDEYNTFTDK